MRTVNRSAVVIRWRRPCIKWALSFGVEDSDERFAVKHHITVYLVPPDPDGHTEAAPLEDYYSRIFEEELAGWCPDEADWPAVRDFATFLRWFDAEPAGLVFHLDEATELALEDDE